MIQRIQSIWLFLSSLFSAITFRFPFYSGDWTKDVISTPVDLYARTTTWLTIITVLAGVVSLINIFFFGNRKLQLRLCYLGIFITVILLAMYFLEIRNFSGGTIALWCIFYFAILACYIMAAIGINKDQKLIKSLDRLR